MFGLNPITLYLLAGLVFTNIMTGVAWQIQKHATQAEKERVIACQTKFDTFKGQVETLGKQQEKKVAEVIATAKTITKDTETRYETRLAAMRVDYQRMRKQYTNSGGGGVSTFPVAPARVDEIPTDCLPLAEQAAETTLMLESLQGWVDEQTENLTDLRIRNDTNTH